MALEQAQAIAGQTTLEELAAVVQPWFRTLIQEHLTPACRMQLFSTAPGLAAAVMSEAPRVSLAIVEPAYTCNGSHKRRQLAFRSLLAAAPSSKLYVTLLGEPDVKYPKLGGPLHGSLWQCIPKQQVLGFSLSNVHITADALLTLQLHQCSNLQTLQLGQGCTVAWNAFWALSVQGAAWLPQSVTRLIVMTNVHNFGPRVYTSLQCLTHVEVGLGFVDDLLEVLPQVPSVTHLTVGVLLLTDNDYSTLPLQLQQLRCRSNTLLSELLKLPLQNIGRLVVEGLLHCGSNPERFTAGAAHLAKCPQLQCIPTPRRDGTGAPLSGSQPSFTIKGQWNADIINMCSNSLTADCIFELDDFSLQKFGLALPTLNLQAAARVTSVWLSSKTGDVYDPGMALTQQQREQIWEGVVLDVLPAQISQIHLRVSWPPDSWWLHVSALAKAISEDYDHATTTTVYVGLSTDQRIPPALQALIKRRPSLVKTYSLQLWG